MSLLFKSLLRNKGFVIVFVFYVLTFWGDLITTLMNWKNIPHLETNFIYRVFGSLWPIIVLNVVVIVALWWIYHNKKTLVGTRFVLILLMVVVGFIRILAMENAIEWAGTELTTEEVMAIATPEAKLETQKQFAFMAYVPFFICFLTYAFWRWDHAIRRKDKPNK